MARETLNNNETGLSVRTKLNSMFTELYLYMGSGLTFCGILNSGDSVTGSPAAGYFYFVNEAGTYGGQACVQFDALIYSGSAWALFEGFGGGKLVEVQERSDGTPATWDPLTLSEVVHTLTRTYDTAPEVQVVAKCDWLLYVKSVTLATGVVTVTVGVGSTGVAEEADFDYDLHVFLAVP